MVDKTTHTNKIGYNEVSQGYDELHGQEQKKKLNIIIKLVKELGLEKEKLLILDVGCGTGLSKRLEEQLRGKIVGIDPSEKLLEQSRLINVLGRAEKLPFLDDQFDLVMSVTAIHNFNDISQGLDEMIRVAKKYLVVTVLKKSKKVGEIEKLIKERLKIVEEVEEDKDKIFLAKKFL